MTDDIVKRLRQIVERQNNSLCLEGSPIIDTDALPLDEMARCLREAARAAPERAVGVLTYQNQPDNIGAWRIGEACAKAKPGGDYIDHGLYLLKELEAKGYGIVALTAAPVSALVPSTGAVKVADVECILLRYLRIEPNTYVPSPKTNNMSLSIDSIREAAIAIFSALVPDPAAGEVVEAVAAEREACLKAALGVCEDMRNEGETDMRMARDRIDDVIRARAEAPAREALAPSGEEER